MPLYRFLCKNCGREELILMKIDQKPPSCSVCGGALEKQISMPSLKLSTQDSMASGSSCGSCSSRNCSSCGT